MSSLNEISADQVVRGEGRRYSPVPHPFLQQASGQIFKDDVNGFSSISDISYMVRPYLCTVIVVRLGPNNPRRRFLPKISKLN